MRLVVLTLLLLVYPRVCRDPVYFITPQPDGAADVLTFPAAFQGAYLQVRYDSTEVDSHLVMIHGGNLVCKSIYLITIPKDSLPGSDDARRSHDTLYWNNEDMVSFSTFSPRNDSFVVRSELISTIFMPTDTSVLRFDEGVCFLNYHDRESGAFYVEVVFLQTDTLVHAAIDLRFEKNQLAQDFELNGDGPPFFVQPHRGWYSSYLKKGGFSSRDTFVRLAGSRKK